MLSKNPKYRLTLGEFLRHPWINNQNLNLMQNFDAELVSKTKNLLIGSN